MKPFDQLIKFLAKELGLGALEQSPDGNYRFLIDHQEIILQQIQDRLLIRAILPVLPTSNSAEVAKDLLKSMTASLKNIKESITISIPDDRDRESNLSLTELELFRELRRGSFGLSDLKQAIDHFANTLDFVSRTIAEAQKKCS